MNTSDDRNSLILLNKMTAQNFNNYRPTSTNSAFLAPNGLVNIFDNENVDTRMEMMERIALTNKSTDYREAISSSYEETPLSRLFFLKENIDIIQHALRAGVYEKSNQEYIIAPQNINELKKIMRNIYLQDAKDLLSNKNFWSVTDQISKLNGVVIAYCVDKVYNEAVGYIKYMHDKSFLPIPMNHPKRSDREYKDLEFRDFF